jgi:SAM-dependent methyltransferase
MGPAADEPTLGIDFDHSRNPATVQGAAATLSRVFSSNLPTTLLDVGCGTGTWLRAAANMGIQNVVGIDGIVVAEDQLHIPGSNVKQRDLTVPFDLGRRFDFVLCLEVAEHIPESSAATLVSSLVFHSDNVLFSAACPRQPGQHHVNCQWPDYWQRLFNSRGFICEDSLRWQIWEDSRIEPWYRQNIFWARRDPLRAGQEARLLAVIHPELFEALNLTVSAEVADKKLQSIAVGSMPWTWYFAVSMRAAFAKLVRRARKWTIHTEGWGLRCVSMRKRSMVRSTSPKSKIKKRR